jgi:catechol 2,3-dioxygenase-like lactoylglutathione lyase family enzyme
VWICEIDHVEMFVPDRYEAARWYEQVLGLTIVPDYEEWAANPRGPLMISNDGGRTKLALFAGEPQGPRPTSGFHLVAFRVDADGFIMFLARLNMLELKDHREQPVSAGAVVDHRKSYSIYFSDPYGHRLEVTTYEYEATRAALAAPGRHR